MFSGADWCMLVGIALMWFLIIAATTCYMVFLPGRVRNWWRSRNSSVSTLSGIEKKITPGTTPGPIEKKED
jgi:hypothetical protein